MGESVFYFLFDPHVDPHGETSGRKQRSKEYRRPHPFGAKMAGKRWKSRAGRPPTSW